MANSAKGRIWDLDTAGVVQYEPVMISHAIVTWKLASAGALVLTEVSKEDGEGTEILNVASLGATSAATMPLSQVFPINTTVAGLKVKTITDIGDLKLYIK